MSDKCEKQRSIYEVFRQLGLETAKKRNRFQRLPTWGPSARAWRRCPTATGDVWILFVGTRENMENHPALNSLSGALIHLGRCESDED